MSNKLTEIGDIEIYCPFCTDNPSAKILFKDTACKSCKERLPYFVKENQPKKDQINITINKEEIQFLIIALSVASDQKNENMKQDYKDFLERFQREIIMAYVVQNERDNNDRAMPDLQ